MRISVACKTEPLIFNKKVGCGGIQIFSISNTHNCHMQSPFLPGLFTQLAMRTKDSKQAHSTVTVTVTVTVQFVQ